MRGLVEKSKRRSGWPVRITLKALGISITSYYRCPRYQERKDSLLRSQPFETLEEEKKEVRGYPCNILGSTTGIWPEKWWVREWSF